jgi:hypothetical protein
LYTQLENKWQPLVNVEVVAHVTRPELRKSEVNSTHPFIVEDSVLTAVAIPQVFTSLNTYFYYYRFVNGLIERTDLQHISPH